MDRGGWPWVSWRGLFMVLKQLFLLQEREEPFSRDAISFFIGDTDPGNFSTFQKQSLCFSVLLCFISTFLFFSKLCSQLQTYLRERGEWMPAYTLASTRVLPFCWLYKLQTSHHPARKWPEWKAFCKQEISWLKLLTGGRGSWATCRGLDREIGDKRML